MQQSQVGVASALVNTSQQLGGSIGAALLSTIFASSAPHYLSSNHGVPDLAAGMFALGMLLTLIIVPIRRVTSDDQPTPPPRPVTTELGSVWYSDGRT